MSRNILPQRGAFTRGVAMLLFVLSGSSWAAQNNEFFYYSDGRQISLLLSHKTIAVRFEEQLSSEQQQSLIESEPRLGSFFEKTEIPSHRLVLLDLKKEMSREDVLGTIASLHAKPGIEFANPVFVVSGAKIVLTDEFVVKFKNDISRSEIAALNAMYSIMVSKELWDNWYLLKVARESGLNALDVANLYYEHPYVTYSHPNFVEIRCDLLAVPNDVYYPYNPNNTNYQWNLNNTGQYGGEAGADIHAQEGWDRSQGSSSIIIAILDTGVDVDHPDLVNNLVLPGIDTTSGGPPPGKPPGAENCSPGYNYHGTACAGIAAAVTNNSEGVAGVGWNCRILPVRMGDGGSCWATYDELSIAAGIHEAVNRGAHVLSMSFSCDLYDQVATEIRNARNDGRGGKGCVLVGASGNYVPGCYEDFNVVVPAAYPEVIAVGATDLCDYRKRCPGSLEDPYRCFNPCTGNEPEQCLAGTPCAWESCYNYKLDVVAPGVKIYTTDHAGDCGQNAGNYHDSFTGTSGACPHVSGLAALILSIDPNLTASQVQAILEFSADDQVGVSTEDTLGRDIYMGYGRINMDRALELAAAKRFVIRDSNARHVASIDDQGNFVLEGNLQTGVSNITPTTDKEFLIRWWDWYYGTGYYYRALVTTQPDAQGMKNMKITGQLYERQPQSVLDNPPYLSFIIRNSTATNVAYIDTWGNLVLKGRAFLRADPDRLSSQGN